jgi:SAM-dependent methyltransferase
MIHVPHKIVIGFKIYYNTCMERCGDFKSATEIYHTIEGAYFEGSHFINAAFEVEWTLRDYFQSPSESWERASGLRVLDVGCGSVYVHELWNGPSISAKPYFARMMGANGAIVTGIDIHPGSDEDEGLYRHIVKDIITPVVEGRFGQLPEFAGQQFDIIHSARLMGKDVVTEDPGFANALWQNHHMSSGKFRESFIGQAYGLLAEGGLIRLDEERYRKVNGKLVSLATP